MDASYLLSTPNMAKEGVVSFQSKSRVNLTSTYLLSQSSSWSGCPHDTDTYASDPHLTTSSSGMDSSVSTATSTSSRANKEAKSATAVSTQPPDSSTYLATSDAKALSEAKAADGDDGGHLGAVPFSYTRFRVAYSEELVV